MNDSGLISNYELVLKHREKKLAPMYFNEGQASAIHSIHVLYKYAIENVLHYTPSEAAARLNDSLADKLKLLDLTNEYYEYPPGLPTDQKYKYICHKIYPHAIKFSIKQLTLSVYERALEITGTQNKFPKNFFSGYRGMLRSCICLQAAIIRFLNLNSTELYAFFADQKKAMSFLKQYHLDHCCKDNFLHPLDFAHAALPSNLKNEFLYRYHIFQNQQRTYKKGGLLALHKEGF